MIMNIDFNKDKPTKSYKALIGGLIVATFGHNIATASELTIPNSFTAGTPARASEVNQNFDATATAVNDNDSRITTLSGNLETTNATITDNISRIAALEAALTALTQRVDELESSQQNVMFSSDTHYATDLVFLSNNADGSFIISDASGNQSEVSVVATNYEYHPMPGLDTVSFNVAEDDTTVIIETSGEAYLSQWNAYSSLSVAIQIDGIIPTLGAQKTLRMVTDDNISSGGGSWTVRYPVQLDAGDHTFSVMLKAHNQNQSSVGVDGRSIEGHNGRIKATVMQVHTGSE